jgi:hypothetical protein
MTEKILGIILLFTGILIMFVSGWNLYEVFTKHAQPVRVFSLRGISIDPTQLVAGNLPPQVAQQMKTNPSGSTPMEIFPAESLNAIINLMAHVILMGFIASIGYRLASLGVQLIRTLVVKYNVKETIQPPMQPLQK